MVPSASKNQKSHLGWGDSFDLPPPTGSTRDRHSRERTFSEVLPFAIIIIFLHSRWWVEYCGWEFSCSTKAIVLWLNPYLLRRLWPIRKALCFTFECWGGQKACSHNFVFIRSIYHTVVTLTFVLKFPHGIFKRHKVKALSYCNFFYWSENHRT